MVKQTIQRQRRQVDWFERLSVLIFPAVAFVGGMALNAYTIAEKIATKPYVDDRFTESKRYTDEKTSQNLKDAYEHSDANRQAMMLQFEKNNALMTGFEVKVDLLRTSVDTLYNEALKNARMHK